MEANEKSQVELEQKIHSLLCGGLEEHEHQEALLLLARDAKARKILTEMLEVQKESRAAFGYDKVPIWRLLHQNGLDAAGVKAKLANRAAHADTGRRKKTFRRFRDITWVWRIAAMIVIAVSTWVAITARRSSQSLQTQLTEIKQSIAAPAMKLTAGDVARYRTIWSQISGGTEAKGTWVLLTNGGGEFGSIADPHAKATHGSVLLVQYWISDKTGRCVYTADILASDRKMMELKLPEAGSIAGRPASLTVSTADDRATVGLSIGGQRTLPAGVVGQMLIGIEPQEVGRFVLDGESFRVFARTQRLSGFQS